MVVSKKRIKRRCPKGRRFKMACLITDEKSIVCMGLGKTQTLTRSSKEKSDWEELADICYSSAQKSRMTYDQAQKTLRQIRKSIDAGDC
jgi:hypothetical protein